MTGEPPMMGQPPMTVEPPGSGQPPGMGRGPQTREGRAREGPERPDAPGQSGGRTTPAGTVEASEASPAEYSPQLPDTLAPGKPAPTLVALRLDTGRRVVPDTLPNRPRLLIFGSRSAPTFRDHIPAINQLHRDFRNRVEVVVLYTAEAYPVGGWELDRNRQDRVRVERHRSEADRLAVAREARDVLGIEATVWVDDFSDATAAGFGLMPNGAVLLGRDGTVLYVQRWFDPHRMRAAVTEALRTRGGPPNPGGASVPGNQQPDEPAAPATRP